jgi:Initiator Rep protein, WH2
MESLTINSRIIAPTGDKPLTPAMVTALWIIGDEIDRKGIKTAAADALWLEIPSARLRGEGGRSDNIWLRECLDRLTGLKLTGEWKGEPWGAVVVAEWHIIQGGSVTRLLVPPAAINALRAPETFAKIEAFAAYKLEGHARRLYALLADKKRMTKQHHWIFGLDELRGLLDVGNKTAYRRWNNFRQWVLAPAIAQINDFGTVTVRMTPEKVGRAVSAVRIDWQWKTIDEARETEQENERAAVARRKPADLPREAPPLVAAPQKGIREFSPELATLLAETKAKLAMPHRSDDD